MRFTAALLSLCLMSPTVALAAENFRNSDNGSLQKVYAESVPDVLKATGSNAENARKRGYATPSDASPSDALYDEDGFLLDGTVLDDVSDVTEAAVPADSVIQNEIKTVTAENDFCMSETVDGITITVTAPAGVFPENAELSVSKVTDADEKEKIEESLEKEKENAIPASASFKFDIKIISDGAEVEPDTEKGNVQVSFEVNKDIVRENTDISVYHILDDQEALRAEKLETEVSDHDSFLLEGRLLDAAPLKKAVISVETDSFSVYVVEFTYEGLEYVLEGDGAVFLKNILEKLGIVGEPDSVTVSNEDLFKAEKTSEGWMVYSLLPFISEEWMDVTVESINYRIKVTDASNYLNDLASLRDTIKAAKVREGRMTQNQTLASYYNGYCGAWVYAQLTYGGIGAAGTDIKSTAYGKDFCNVQPEGRTTSAGYRIVKFSGSNAFENLLSSIPQPIEHVAISFDGRSGNTAGHVVYIRAIENNTVYFMDSYTYRGAWTACEPSAVSLSNFKRYEASAVGSNINSVVWYSKNQNVVKPSITKVEFTELRSSGYVITATVRKGTYDVARVRFPSWSDYNGQDDLDWRDYEEVETIDANTKKYKIWMSDCWHNFDKGLYHNHIYAYDTAGNYSMVQAQSITLANKGVQDYTRRTTWNGHTYYYVEDNLTWAQAKAACEAAGGHLATITSSAEQSAVIAGLKNADLARRHQMYLGGKVINGKVQWVTGENASFTVNWGAGQPDNNAGQENCLAVFTGYSVDLPAQPAGTFNDFISNAYTTGYILEIDPKVTYVTLNNSALQLNAGAASTLTATVLPGNAVNKTVTWSSSNSSIATVTSGGVVKGVAPGTATITVRTNDGGYTANCVVTVRQPVTGVSLNRSSLTLEAGKSAALKATVAPSGAGNKAVTWSTGNSSIATVTSGGVVKGVAPGTTTITVRTNDGRKTAACKVTVIKKDPVEEFVKRLYKGCYGRTAESSGLNYWTASLKNGSQTGASAARFFFMSNEMKALNLSDGEYINRLYTVIMGRTADTAGKKHWLECIRNGMSYEWLVKSFIDSTEFTQICQDYGIRKGSVKLTQNRDRNYGVTSFVARIYLKALGRSYDIGGLNYWTGEILDSSNRKEMMVSAAMNFLNSNEFKDKDLNNTEYIKVLYRTFFGREYDVSGLNYWKEQLVTGKTTRAAVLKSFANSKEFASLMKEYGIQ